MLPKPMMSRQGGFVSPIESLASGVFLIGGVLRRSCRPCLSPDRPTASRNMSPEKTVGLLELSEMKPRSYDWL